jgi:hypothetical protein
MCVIKYGGENAMKTKTFALDENWDMYVDTSGNLAVINGKKRVAQDVATACRLFKGEAIFHVDTGIPYFADILGQAPQRAIIREHLRRQALTVPDVADVSIRDYAYQGRTLSAEIVITDNLAIETTEGKKKEIDDFYSLIDVYETPNVYRIRI